MIINIKLLIISYFISEKLKMKYGLFSEKLKTKRDKRELECKVKN